MRVILAQPRGFCAGVVRAIEIVDRALQQHGAPVYVRHEIVHNRHVVDNLRQKGARFVEELDEVLKRSSATRKHAGSTCSTQRARSSPKCMCKGVNTSALAAP
jgi:4-hydroxy-3-methylbut-2-enyl diphosphate reductase